MRRQHTQQRPRVVVCRVGGGDAHGEPIAVAGEHAALERLCGGDGEDAGARADIEDHSRPLALQHIVEREKATARARVMAVPKACPASISMARRRLSMRPRSWLPCTMKRPAADGTAVPLRQRHPICQRRPARCAKIGAAGGIPCPARSARSGHRGRAARRQAPKPRSIRRRARTRTTARAAGSDCFPPDGTAICSASVRVSGDLIRHLVSLAHAVPERPRPRDRAYRRRAAGPTRIEMVPRLPWRHRRQSLPSRRRGPARPRAGGRKASSASEPTLAAAAPREEAR